ncbi:MAG: protein translocase subunit SecF [Acidimicrobiia bacterium]|nr:protein translocase subunit SecF [Acidimicrobiia bacterium]
MSFVRTLYRGETNIDFRPLWKRSVAISGALVVVSLLLLLVRGLNLSIDFEGGGVWEVPVAETVTVADGRAAAGIDNARVQLVEDPGRGTFVRVQSGTADIDRSPEIVAGLAELGNVSIDEVSVSTVGPTWGSQITSKALRALVFFFLAVAAYLAWRLEWRMAIGALVAVVHDLAITGGVYSLFWFEVSPATIIALLTILGYSLYDTVVVYDKVLENQDSPIGDGVTHTELVNRSMNQVLMRSINTTITTVLPVLSMLVIGGVFLGGATLRDFALALFIGLILGTYSSIFLAAPVLAWLKEREPVDDATRRRQRRAAEAFGSEPEPVEPVEPVAVGGVTPRPRKGRKKRR